MNLRNRILLIVAFCIFLCIGSFFIISKIYENLENQLYEKCKIEALSGARIMSELLQYMISRNILTESDIFDTQYIEIKGTNPKKYHTRYDRIFDRWIQEIEDQYLLDEDIDYAILIDRNGYVPTHNTKYSRPETKDYRVDLHNSRSKRNFSSYEGIRRVLEFRGDGAIRVLYNRDTGEVIWNIAAPVKLRGKHWGAFIIGVNLERVGRIKTQMFLLTSITMFLILGITLFIILITIPKRYINLSMDAPRY